MTTNIPGTISFRDFFRGLKNMCAVSNGLGLQIASYINTKVDRSLSNKR